MKVDLLEVQVQLDHPGLLDHLALHMQVPDQQVVLVHQDLLVVQGHLEVQEHLAVLDQQVQQVVRV